MAKNAKVHVIPATGGWTIKSNSGKHALVYKKKSEAETAARKIVKNKGGGEVFIHGRDGRIMDADSIGKGHVGRAIKDPPHGGRLTKSEIRDAVWNGSKALRATK
jgi:hypothetical protein